MFPIYEYIGLSVVELGNPLRCRVPMQGSNANHFGAMHAGVLFSLAEAAAGIAVTQHREFGALVLIAERVVVDFTRPARSDVTAAVALDDGFLGKLQAGLAANPKFRFDIPVVLSVDAGEIVMQAKCTFQLRARHPGP
jgi:uncharacterized protein (TIGR00369 family)